MRIRTAASAVAAFALAVVLTGCSIFTVGMTQKPYDASDGVSVTVGDVRLVNAIVFSADGQDGHLTGAAVNSGDEDVDLVLQYSSGGDKVEVEIEVPARTTTHLGSGDAGQVFLPEIDTPPGSLLKIYFQYGDRPGKQAQIPVLDTALPEYAGLRPVPPPAPAPTVTATPEPTETPAP